MLSHKKQIGRFLLGLLVTLIILFYASPRYPSLKIVYFKMQDTLGRLKDDMTVLVNRLAASQKPPEEVFNSTTEAVVPYPYYDQRCYKYHDNLTAENTCRRLRNFTGDLNTIHTCFRRANADLRKKSGNTSDPQKQRHVNWVIIGDSHMRYLFATFLTRFNGPHLQYKFVNTNWSSAGPLEASIRGNKVMQQIYVRDLTVPMEMTFYWDVYLDNIPKLIDQWLQAPKTTPTYIVVDCGNWWMLRTQALFISEGPVAAAEQYRQHLVRIRPHLIRLAAATRVVFRLLDDFRRGYGKGATQAVNTISNYPYYNQVAIEVLAGTGVIIWDSTRPLSYMYNKVCNKYPKRSTPPHFYWRCIDTDHMGYILVDQYGDMIISDYCDLYLGQ